MLREGHAAAVEAAGTGGYIFAKTPAVTTVTRGLRAKTSGVSPVCRRERRPSPAQWVCRREEVAGREQVKWRGVLRRWRFVQNFTLSDPPNCVCVPIWSPVVPRTKASSVVARVGAQPTLPPYSKK